MVCGPGTTRRTCGEFPTGTPSRKTAPQGLERTAILPALSTVGEDLASVDTGRVVAVTDGRAADVGRLGAVEVFAIGGGRRALVLGGPLGTVSLGASGCADVAIVGLVVGGGATLVVVAWAAVALA